MNTMTYFDAAMAKNLRKKLQENTGNEWRQEDFARALNVGTRTVAGWESTKDNSPTKMTMAARANCLSLMQDHGIESEELGES